MGMARLNVWVSGLDDPCSIDDRTWYVTIYRCDGSVLEWCNKTYVVEPAPCGHLEIDIPPGCYYIKAVWSYWVVTPGFLYRANHFTDAAVVTACCDETTCVTLFNPSAHRCGYIYLRAIQDLVLQRAIAPELAQQLEGVVAAINQQLGRPIKLFELGHEDDFERLAREQGEANKGKKGQQAA